jgi:hypothetical protein
MSGWRGRSGGEWQPADAPGYSRSSHPVYPRLNTLWVQLEHRAQEASDDGEAGVGEEGLRVGECDGWQGSPDCGDDKLERPGLGPKQRLLRFGTGSLNRVQMRNRWAERRDETPPPQCAPGQWRSYAHRSCPESRFGPVTGWGPEPVLQRTRRPADRRHPGSALFRRYRLLSARLACRWPPVALAGSGYGSAARVEPAPAVDLLLGPE